MLDGACTFLQVYSDFDKGKVKYLKFQQESKFPKISHNSVVQSKFSATTAVQKSGDHVKLWTAERFVSLAQIPASIVLFAHFCKFYFTLIEQD